MSSRYYRTCFICNQYIPPSEVGKNVICGQAICQYCAQYMRQLKLMCEEEDDGTEV